MSPTLFKYIFKDLLRVFLLTSGGLAGIMSFGGLLRPLTEHGLDAGQVGKMLTYFMPAMMTYSLPVAALFATSVVYGRLAADNEITAMRPTGL
jgi:lipopolysaccharide export system permease protein